MDLSKKSSPGNRMTTAELTARMNATKLAPRFARNHPTLSSGQYSSDRLFMYSDRSGANMVRQKHMTPSMYGSMSSGSNTSNPTFARSSGSSVINPTISVIPTTSLQDPQKVQSIMSQQSIPTNLSTNRNTSTNQSSGSSGPHMYASSQAYATSNNLRAEAASGSNGSFSGYNGTNGTSYQTGGTSSYNGGTSSYNGGTSSYNGGTSSYNGGTSSYNGGSSSQNGGSSSYNSGSSSQNGGSSSYNGGSSSHNGGASSHNNPYNSSLYSTTLAEESRRPGSLCHNQPKLIRDAAEKSGYKQNKNALQIPSIGPNTKMSVDKTSCVELYLPNSMDCEKRNRLLRESTIRTARPSSILLDKEAFTKEFNAKGEQRFNMDMIVTGPKTYMSVFSTKPNPVKYPDNSIQYIHFINQEKEKVYEKQTRYFKKGDNLACATTFCIERELDKNSALVTSDTTSKPGSQVARVNHPYCARMATFKPNVSTKK